MDRQGTSPVRNAGDWVVRLGVWIAELSVAAMLILIMAEVVARNLLGMSLLVANEFAGYLLVLMTFAGMGYSLRSGALLRIEFTVVALPHRLRGAAEALFDLLALAFLAILIWQLYNFTHSTWRRGMVAPTLSEIPLWIPIAIMPIGAVVLLVACMLELRDNLARAFGYDVPRPYQADPTESEI